MSDQQALSSLMDGKLRAMANAQSQGQAIEGASGTSAPPPAVAKQPDQTTPLFRPEVLAAQSDSLLGTIRIAMPPQLSVVAVLALILIVALALFAAYGQATRKTRVAGVLLPVGGLLQVSTPQAARVHTVQVSEGQAVAKGEVLAVLHLGGHSTKGETAALLHQNLQSRLDTLRTEERSVSAAAQQREQALRDRLRSLQRDQVQMEGELETVHQRVALARASLQRDQGLALQGFLSAAQVQQRQEELLDLQSRERSVLRNAEALKREAQSIEAELEATRIQAQTQHMQLVRAQAALAQEATEVDARHLLRMVAPASATVGTISAHPGQSLQPGQTVFSLLPATTTSPDTIPVARLEAQLYASSRASGFVEPGQAVWIRLHAFAYQKFGMVAGEVTEVSRTPVLPHDLPSGMAQSLMGAAQSQEPLYRITVALRANSLQVFGKSHPLKPGMTLEADIIQDRRAIWEWVLEPLIGIGYKWRISLGRQFHTVEGGVWQ